VSLKWKILQLKGLWVFRKRVIVFGNFTVVDPRRVSIGANCAINHGVFILGNAGITIGENVVLSARCMLMDAGLSPDGDFGRPETRHYDNRPIVIEDGAWIGAGSIILQGVTVGRSSIVGAGSVVTRDVPPLTIVAGNPARVVRHLAEPATQQEADKQIEKRKGE
jgi:acetyltransferase-like isoleucine patch superfamily enzyme